MNTLHFDDMGDFCEFLVDKHAIVTSDNYNSDVNVVGDFDQIKEILEYLICEGFPISSLEFESPEFTAYENDFVLEFGTEGVLVEPAFRENTKKGYFNIFGEGVYVLKPSTYPIEYANNGIFGKDSLGLHYVEIGECCNCECCCHDNESTTSVAAEAVEKAKKAYEAEKKDDDSNVIKIKVTGLDNLSEDERKEKVDMAVENIRYLFDLFDSFDRTFLRRHYSYF